MSAETDRALWIDPASDPTVALTAAQKGSLALLHNSRLLPVCLPEAAPAEGGAVQLDYAWYPSDADTVRVTMAAEGDLVSVQYRHEPCAGDGEGPAEWKVDSGDLWTGLKAAVGQV